MASDEALDVGMQLLNLNYEGEPIEVRHRVSIQYVRDNLCFPRPSKSSPLQIRPQYRIDPIVPLHTAII